MRVGRKLFPYPVINNSEKISSFKDSTFSLVYEDESDEENLILKDAHLIIDDMNLISLISQGKVKGALIVECSATIYREKFDIGMKNRDIIIPLSELNDKVYISSFLYATENISNYKSENFLEDYEDYSFNIEKYDILAADDGFMKIIEYDKATKEWFLSHPHQETTVTQCEVCKLFYKPILGHKCKKQEKRSKNE